MSLTSSWAIFNVTENSSIKRIIFLFSYHAIFDCLFGDVEKQEQELAKSVSHKRSSISNIREFIEL